VRNRSFILVAASLAVLVVGAVALYLYDNSHRDTIANGVKISGIDVGGMSKSEARAKVHSELSSHLQQPIVVAYGSRRFTLHPSTAHVGWDVNASVDEAISRSREGNIITRTWRGVTGGTVKANLAPQVTYSRQVVNRFVEGVARELNRPPQDATLSYSSSGLGKVPGRNGISINAAQLRNGVLFDLDNQRYGGVLRPIVTRTRPKITTSQLAAKYPRVIVVNRNSFTLTLYKSLRRFKSYGIAVGQAGLETPAGLHSVINKQVDPAWSVPNEAWAGSLAGQVIPGGAPDNPLKARWIGFFAGDGIHGTADDASIGSAASHGCIRMHVPDVEDLYDRVKIGDPVYII
jgi:L,D-transpeptidase catalytic domain/Putative peptidoglycan binding domain